MQENAYLAEMLAGLFYIVIGARLLRLAYRTRQVPELLLVIYFASTGLFVRNRLHPRG